MTGVIVKAQRRPIFDKAEDLDKADKIDKDVPAGMPAGRGKMQMICKKILKIGLIRCAKPVLKVGLIRYAKPVLKVGDSCNAL